MLPKLSQNSLKLILQESSHWKVTICIVHIVHIAAETFTHQ